MGVINVKLEPQAMLAYLEESGITVTRVIEAIKAIVPNMTLAEKMKAAYAIIKAVVETTAYNVEVLKTMGVDEALNVGSNAVDKLLAFGGLAGMILESVDNIVIRFLLDFVYEAVRDRDNIDDAGFVEKLKNLFG